MAAMLPPSGRRDNRKFREVAQHVQAFRLTLFRMKLRGDQIVAANHRTKRLIVVRFQGDEAVSVWHDVRGMHEIEVRSVLETGHDRYLADN